MKSIVIIDDEYFFRQALKKYISELNKDYGSITNFVGFRIPLVALSTHIE